VPRYNEFRRQLFMTPISDWNELTYDPDLAATLKRIYGEVDKLDLMVGLYVEVTGPKAIEGFVISETAFFIFILMASRRLESDPLFTKHFTKEVYTPEGMDRVSSIEGLKDLLSIHYPEVAEVIKPKSAFSNWGVEDVKPGLCGKMCSCLRCLIKFATLGIQIIVAFFAYSVKLSCNCCSLDKHALKHSKEEPGPNLLVRGQNDCQYQTLLQEVKQ
jgi:hypothetical protein